jgi:hypothetical protein
MDRATVNINIPKGEKWFTGVFLHISGVYYCLFLCLFLTQGTVIGLMRLECRKLIYQCHKCR